LVVALANLEILISWGDSAGGEQMWLELGVDHIVDSALCHLHFSHFTTSSSDLRVIASETQIISLSSAKVAL
jgi:hypothetical protein